MKRWGMTVWCLSMVLGATSVHAALPSRAAVLATVSSVADNFISAHPNPENNDWAAGVLYIGMADAFDATGNANYQTYMQQHAASLKWLINGGTTTTNANKYAVGQEYLHLSSDTSDLASLVAQTNAMVDAGNIGTWTWVDTIYMQMNDFTELGNRLGNSERDYHGHMYKMFDYTRTKLKLYDTTDHLWYRDGTFTWPSHQSPNGKKIYWSRGNGWVFASLARTLSTLSPASPEYSVYKQVFTDMAAALVSRQRSDGFWNSNLDDPLDHGGPETTGTAAFTYGLAVGIRMNLLTDPRYATALQSAWSGLVSTAVKSTGALGYCQPEGAAPGTATATSSSDFCVGLVLRAGSELSRIAPSPPADYALNAPVSYSSQQTGNEATHLVDGITTGTNRWAAQGYPQWVRVDLGAVKTITRTELTPYLSRAYQYKIEGSTDGVSYTTLVDRTSNKAGGTTLFDVFNAANVRYVRLTVTGATAYSNQGDWVSIQELAVHP